MFAVMACSKQIATSSDTLEVHGKEDIPTGIAQFDFFVAIKCF